MAGLSCGITFQTKKGSSEQSISLNKFQRCGAYGEANPILLFWLFFGCSHFRLYIWFGAPILWAFAFPKSISSIFGSIYARDLYLAICSTSSKNVFLPWPLDFKSISLTTRTRCPLFSMSWAAGLNDPRSFCARMLRTQIHGKRGRYSSVVERALRKRTVGGSIPPGGWYVWTMHYVLQSTEKLRKGAPGFEPGICWFAVSRSTTELYTHAIVRTPQWNTTQFDLSVPSKGLFRESNPGPLAPEAGIIPLDQTASAKTCCHRCSREIMRTVACAAGGCSLISYFVEDMIPWAAHLVWCTY